MKFASVFYPGERAMPAAFVGMMDGWLWCVVLVFCLFCFFTGNKFDPDHP